MVAVATLSLFCVIGKISFKNDAGNRRYFADRQGILSF